MMGPMGGGGGGPRPTRRNPMMLLLVQLALACGGQIIANVLYGMIGFAATGVGNLVGLAGYLWFAFNASKMSQELKNFTNDPQLNPIFMWIPCLNIYSLVLQVPAIMQRAKQQAGSQAPARGAVVYFFIGLWAFASDLNDIAG